MHSYADLFRLDGKVAIVTGGTKGLGQAMATGMAQFGADIVIADRTIDDAEEVVDGVTSAGRKIILIKTDISQKAQVQKVVDRTIEELGKIDILVNNAGTSFRAPAVDFEKEEFDRVLSVNLVGTFLCSQAVALRMIESERSGSIINISSIAGVVGVPHTIAYSASKGGVTQMTKALALEWAPYGIRVNAIAPCPFETALSKKVFEKQPEVYSNLVRQIPLGRPGQPPDIVGASIFLASNASSMVTGHILSVDGGWVAQ